MFQMKILSKNSISSSLTGCRRPAGFSKPGRSYLTDGTKPTGSLRPSRLAFIAKLISSKAIILLSFFLFSCKDYLEPEMINLLSDTEVEEDYNYSRGRLASIYGDLQSGFSGFSGTMMANASDEAEFTTETGSVHRFNEGTWNQLGNPDDVWSDYYQSIRKIHVFLNSCDNINLDFYYPQPAVYEARLAEVRRWQFEARFIRAYHYFELVKRYGGVPLLRDAVEIDDDFHQVARASLDDCIRFIVDEFDEVSKALPARYDNNANDLGRVTSVAALALKSRVLLYAASELFNNPDWATGYAHPELISLAGKSRQERWQAAASAAKEAIELAEDNGYLLGTDYRALFGPTTHSSNEVLFCRRNGASNSFELANVSVGFNRGNSGTTPSQNLVDAYEMTDGSAFDWNNPVHAADPYAYRDPRLQMTIVANNSVFKGRAMECWYGGQDGPPIVRASRTGYYLKKYVDENLNLVTGTTSVHGWAFFRLAELYLNYAEALNECDPDNSDVKMYVNKVRQRAGVDMPELPDGLTQPQMRERIYNERRVELAFEEHRFWDVRRWMTAPSTLGVPLKGVQITRTGDDQFNYNVVDIERRVFLPKMYLYPISQAELYIARGLVQNPLW